MARTYDLYVLVARTKYRESGTQRTGEILLLPREHKIHIFELTCTVLFIIWTTWWKHKHVYKYSISTISELQHSECNQAK